MLLETGVGRTDSVLSGGEERWCPVSPVPPGHVMGQWPVIVSSVPRDCSRLKSPAVVGLLVPAIAHVTGPSAG